MEFIYFLMDAFSVLSIGIEDYLFIEVVSINVDVLPGVSLPEEDSHAVLESKLCSQPTAKFHHLRNAIDDYILFWLEI